MPRMTWWEMTHWHFSFIAQCTKPLGQLHTSIPGLDWGKARFAMFAGWRRTDDQNCVTNNILGLCVETVNEWSFFSLSHLSSMFVLLQANFGYFETYANKRCREILKISTQGPLTESLVGVFPWQGSIKLEGAPGGIVRSLSWHKCHIINDKCGGLPATSLHPLVASVL